MATFINPLTGKSSTSDLPNTSTFETEATKGESLGINPQQIDIATEPFETSSLAPDRNPLIDHLAEPTEQALAQEQDEEQEWRIGVQRGSDTSLLDFENFRPEEKIAVRKQLLIRSYMDAELDFRPESSNSYQLQRGIYSNKLFGEDLDDDQLFERLTERAQRRSQVGNAFESGVRLGREAAALGKTGQVELGELLKDPALSKEQRIEIRREHHRAREAYEKQIEPFRDEALAMARHIVADTDTEAYDFATDLHGKIDKEDIPAFIDASIVAAVAMSDEGDPEEARRSMLKAWHRASIDLQHYVKGVANQPAPVDDMGRALSGLGLPDPMAEEREEREEDRQMRQDAHEFARDIVAHMRSFNPVVTAEDGALTQGLYSLPQAAQSTALALVPGIGLGASAAYLQQSYGEQARQRLIASGVDRDKASKTGLAIGTVTMIPAMLLERVGATSLIGKAPGLSPLLSKLNSRVGNKYARFGASWIGKGIAETATEVGQDAVFELVSDLAAVLDSELPDHDSSEFFSTLDETIPSLAVPSFLMAGIGALGTARQEADLRTIAMIERLDREAVGFRKEDNDAIDKAMTDGDVPALREAVASAYKHHDPHSDEAVEARVLKADQERETAAAQQEAEDLGLRPIIATSEKGFVIREAGTSNIIAEVETEEEAAREFYQAIKLDERNQDAAIKSLAAKLEAISLVKDQSGRDQELEEERLLSEEGAISEFGGNASQRILEEKQLLEKADGLTGEISSAVLDESAVVFGAALPAGSETLSGGRHEAAMTKLYKGSTVWTVLHEETHHQRRNLMSKGLLTRQEQIDFFTRIDRDVLAGKFHRAKYGDQDGQSLTFLPQNAVIEDSHLDEAASIFMETMLLQTEGGKKSRMRELLNENLSNQIAAHVPGAKKFKAFLGAMRAFFGLNVARSVVLKKAVRDGKLDQAELDAFAHRLRGTSEQAQYDADVEMEYREITAEQAEAARNFVPTDEIPFSISQEASSLEKDVISAAHQREAGAFSGISYSVGTGKNLVAVHNLTSENLLVAMKDFGVIPPPSIAIVRTDISDFDSFGEISLIAPPGRVDPKASRKNHVWNADAYTPRFPSGVEYLLSKTSEKELKESLLADAEAIGLGEYDIVPGDFQEEGWKAMLGSPVAQASFLRSKGIKVRPVMTKPPQVPAAMKKLAKKHQRFQLTELPEFIDLVGQEIEKKLEQYKKPEVRKTMRNAYFDQSGNPSFRVLDEWAEQAHEASQPPKYSQRLTRNAIQQKVARRQKAFDRWARERFSDLPVERRIFNGFNYSGSRRYLKYNLDNVVRLMTKDLAGGEGFNYGIGSIRSQAARKFKSIEEIKRSRDSIVTEEDLEAFKQETEKDFDEIAELLEEDYAYDSNSFTYLSNLSEHLGEFAAGKLTEWREAFPDLSEEKTSTVAQFIQKLKTAPTEYFEVKVAEGVPLSDFKTAIIPKGSGREIRETLKGSGLKVKTYESSKPGDRARVIREEAERAKVSFSISPSQDAAYLRAVESGDMETAQEMVDAAAKAAGYDSPRVYHGTNSEEFEVFERARFPLFFFSENKDYAERYGDRVISAYLRYGKNAVTDREVTFDEVTTSSRVDLWKRFTGEDAIDTLISKPAGENQETIVRSPSQIKSADAVTYDAEGNVIPLSERFNERDDRIAYSLGSAAMLDPLISSAARKIKDPEAKARHWTRVAERLNALKRDVDRRIIAFGKEIEQPRQIDPRTLKSLKKEAAFRQAVRHEELELAAWEKHGEALAAEEMTTLRSMPLHAYIGDPMNPLKGSLMSKSAAIREGKYDPKKHGDYDGADGISRSLFGGSRMPDQMASELHHEGLINDPYADTMWDALRSERDSVEKMKEAFDAAEKAMKVTKKEAKKYADEWLEERKKEQSRTYNKPAEIRRALVTYDALVLALPIELRGKLGGHTQLAKLNSDQSRLEWLLERLEKADGIVEKWIADTVRDDVKKIMKSVRPKKTGKGVPKAKLAAAQTDRIVAIEKLSALDQDDVDGRLEKLVEAIDLETDQTVIDQLSTEMAELMAFGNVDGMGSVRLSEFLSNLQSIVRTGKMLKEVADAEFRQEADRVIGLVNHDVTGGAGRMTSSQSKLAQKERDEKGLPLKKLGFDENFKLSGLTKFHRKNLSFEWLLNAASRANKNVGTLKSETHRELASRVHLATHKTKRDNADMQLRYQTFMSSVFGGLRGLKLSKEIGKLVDEVDTGIRRIDYKGKGATSNKELRAANVQAVLSNEAEIDSLGINETEWKLAKKSYEKLVAKAKDGKVKGNRVVRYKAPNVGQPESLILSQGQAINLTMLFRQKALRESMIHEGYTEEVMAQVEKFLTPEATRIREWLAAEYADNYHVVNRTFREANGVSLPQIENYSPAKRKAEGSVRELEIDSSGNSAMSSSPGFIISRTTNFAQVDQTADALSIYMQHMVQTNHYVNWAQPIKLLRTVFGDVDVKQNLTDYSGQDLLSTISERIEWMADGGNRKASHIRWLDRLRSAHTFSSLAFNWGVGIKQLTSLPAFAFDMPVADFGKYSAKFFASPVENAKEMMAEPYVRTRFKEGYDRDVIDGLRKEGGAIMKGLQLGMLTGKTGDIIPVIVGGWMAKHRSYDMAIADGMSEADAQAKAALDFEMVVDRSQQAGDLKDLSSFQAGGSLFKLFTMYDTSPRQYYANVYESFLDFKAGKKGAKAEFFRRFTIGQIILPITFQFASDMLRNFVDDEELDPANYLRAVLLGSLNGLFIAGDFLELLSYGAADTKLWEKKITVADGATKAARGIKSFWDGDFAEGVDEVAIGIGRTTPSALTFYSIFRKELGRFGIGD